MRRVSEPHHLQSYATQTARPDPNAFAALGRSSRSSSHHVAPHDFQHESIEYALSSSIAIEPYRRSGHFHTRSSSLNGAKEVGNLNRWSQSTEESNGGGLYRTRSNSASRMSVGSPLSPKRLPKIRRPISPSSRPLPASRTLLPPIVTVPSLVHSGTTPSTGNSPSTAGLLSAAVHSTAPDYFGRSWDDTAPRDFAAQRGSPSRSDNLDPAQASSLAPASNGGQAGDERPVSRGHSRNHSNAGKSSSSSHRSSKQPSQKAMLSKALQKANTAVLLDNAQNFEGAVEAYTEACELLQQVMVRSSGDEDRRKLEAIRSTYTSRIAELRKSVPHLQDEEKALPARPESGGTTFFQPLYNDEESYIGTATATRIVNDGSYDPRSRSRTDSSSHPRRRESLLPSAIESTGSRSRKNSDAVSGSSRYPQRDRESLVPPMDRQYMPPPLSPRRGSAPLSNDHPARKQSTTSEGSTSRLSPGKGHSRAPSNESMSWLDTIDESGGSNASSVHSRTPSHGIARRRLRSVSGATEAEFDAALDAAVEAAYDDGLEPTGQAQHFNYDYGEDDEIVANVRRRVEMAKERVRQSEREVTIQNALERERRRALDSRHNPQKIRADDGYENESDEEEAMLEEMTRGYVMDDFEFGIQSKSALPPRESDSSGYSGRTWHSSIGSNPTTSGTVLSTVTEASPMPQMLKSRIEPPSHPPPAQALPPPPDPALSQTLAAPQGVRGRRLSGQNPKQLKIETAAPSQPPSMPPPRIPRGLSPGPKSAGPLQQKQPLSSFNRPPVPQTARRPSSPFDAPSPSDTIAPPAPLLKRTMTTDAEDLSRSVSPGFSQSRSAVRKNYSSASLKNIKGHNLSVANAQNDEYNDLSPHTPLSSTSVAREGRLPAIPALPTPMAMAFREKMNGLPAAAGGLYLFQSDFHSPDSPGSPNPLNDGAPIPLEPCPTDFLLRPFWLMRALYQTIAHPRGGYLSTKLFVPRDVWRVKGVKIKGVEDKIANCDFLTAALLKLAKVDSLDADAVLEEMQAFETVLEQVQTTLTKKLGSDVGIQGSGTMFKDAPFGADFDMGSTSSKSSSTASKASSFSWRRLRSKNSGVGLSNSYANKNNAPDSGQKEGLTMPTLPMTSAPKNRSAKRDVTQVQYTGPNANYMSALAKLFDAAQAIDQIARQVEDPGLRHADKTQVGLELCTRHAAEFFGFYICRFVLADIGILLDKFIKRGSEWVLE